MSSDAEELRKIDAILREGGDSHRGLEFRVAGTVETARSKQLLHDAAPAGVSAEAARLGHEQVEFAVIHARQDVRVAHAGKDRLCDFDRGIAQQGRSRIATLFDGECRQGKSTCVATSLIDFASRDIDEGSFIAPRVVCSRSKTSASVMAIWGPMIDNESSRGVSGTVRSDPKSRIAEV